MPRELPAGTSYPILEGVASDENGAVDLTTADTISLFVRLEPFNVNPPVELAADAVLPQTGDDEGRFTADIDPTDLVDVGEWKAILKVKWDAPGNDISYFGVDTITVTVNPAIP